MRTKILISTVVLVLSIGAAVVAGAKTGGKDNDKDVVTSNLTTNHAAQDDPLRLEGERAYHANCGRCHMAPPKFSPRMMGTIVRHMRVRAAITDQEMRSILHYMSQ